MGKKQVKVIRYLFFVLLSLFGFSSISAQTLNEKRTIQQIESEDTLRVNPGEVLTLSLPLINTLQDATKAKIRISLPENWKNLIKMNSVAFGKKERKTILLHTYPSSSALAGFYRLRCEVDFLYERFIYTFPCIVEEVNKIQLTFGETQDFIKAGDTIQTTLHVSNLGNIKRDFIVTLKGINGKEKKEILQIAPSSSAIVPVNEITNKNSQYQTVEHIYADVALSETAKPIAFASASTHVIPQKEKPYDRYLRVPSYLGISYFGRHRNNNFEGGWQAEAYGLGYLDEAQTHTLEYRLRGPDRYYISSMANYEEYFIKYRSPSTRAVLGDDSYRLSLLTEYARYGRGAFLSTRLRHFVVGGFYLKPRFYPTIKQEIAGFGEFHFMKTNKIRVNYLWKNLHQTSSQTHLSSIEGYFSPLKNTKIELEYAMSRFQEKKGNAYSAKFSSTYFRRLIANGYIVFADKNFSGYYQNSLHFGGNAFYRIAKKWEINGGLSKTSYNVALDTLFTQAPTRENDYIGVGYRINKRHKLSLQTGYRAGKDRLQVKRYEYDEYYGRLNYYLTNNQLQLFSTIELSSTNNLLVNDQKQQMWRRFISSNVNYQFNSSFNLGAFASFSRHNRYSEEIRNYLFAGASANLNIAQKTRLLLRMQNSFSIEDDYQDRSYFDLSLSHFFTPQHEFVLQNRYALPRKHTKDALWEFGVQYRFHFGLPVRRKSQRLSSLIGRVYTDDQSHIPNNNVLLHMSGKSVYTDEDGNFEFKNMPLGEHYLFIDKSKMNMDVVANASEPIKVALRGDGENKLSVRLSQSAKLKGKIVIKNAKVDGEDRYKSSEVLHNLTKAPNITPIVVELYNDEISYKRITNKKGEFDFQQIMPGRWRLKIYPNGLLQKYKLKQNEFEFELRQGESKAIEIPVLPKKINIRFKPANADKVEKIE